MNLVKLILATLLVSISWADLMSQAQVAQQDSFRPKRFWTIMGAGAGIYTATVIGLNEAWYRDFEKTRFHFFDDWREWQNMDKMGHAYTTYFESELCYQGALWTGMSRKQAVWAGTGVALLLQSTVEVLDGFSSQWGFSLYDMAYNVAGAALFAAQELTWHEQRLRMKVSSWRRSYDTAPIQSTNGMATSSLARRTDALFGISFMERYLKDYNAQTIWLSSNLHAFFESSNLPPWLNVAIGYGSENLYGGYQNVWNEGPATYQLNETQYPRFRQFFISPDLDLTKIKTDSKLLKTAFRILNVFKFPAPALEINGQGNVIFHWLYL